MEEELSTNKQILSILLDYIPNDHICNIIIDMKNTSENKETLQYHMNRWDSIALKYIKAGKINESTSFMTIFQKPSIGNFFIRRKNHLTC